MITLLGALAISIVLAQPPRGGNQAEHVPPEIVLDSIRTAYTSKPTADEVRVAVKDNVTRVGESDRFTIRIDPGQGQTPARILLEMGNLNIYIEGSDVTAISTASPGEYYSAKLPGPPTPLNIARVLPPIPAPQIAMACREADAQRHLTPYSINVNWSDGEVDSARPPVSKLVGSSDAGSVELKAGANGRLTHFTMEITSIRPGRAATLSTGTTTLDMAIAPVNPGDPAKWAIATEGRVRVESLSLLRGAFTPPPKPAPVISEVPDFQFTRPDGSSWALSKVLADPAHPTLALILYRVTSPEKAGAASRDAHAACAALEAVRKAALPDAAPLPAFAVAAAVVVDPGPYGPEQLQAERRAWTEAACTQEVLAAGSAEQSIDRIDAKAAAVLGLIGADRKLIAALPLDGRSADPAALAGAIRAALVSKP